MKSELIFCPTCESAELDERVNAVLHDQKLKTYEEAYELYLKQSEGALPHAGERVPTQFISLNHFNAIHYLGA